MHKLLERQLRRHFGTLEAVSAEVRRFAADVGEAYAAADADRALVERSLELTSQELSQRYSVLRAQQHEIQTILDAVPAYIWYKDQANRIIRCNRAVAESLGRTVEEIEGRAAAEFYPDEAAQYFRDDLEVMSTGRPKVGIIEALRVRDGGRRTVRTDKIPYRDERGNVIGVIVFSIDITAQKQAEERLQHAYERLKELDRFRSQFINNAAHELGTPLTPIKLQIHMLKNRPGDPGGRKNLEILDRSVERLGNLVNDVLDAARLQTGRLRAASQPLDIHRIVREAVESFLGVAQAQGISLEAGRIEEGMVVGDTNRLAQVMTNLLGNAVKFTPAGGRIIVECVREEGAMVVRVEDSGSGIRPEDIAKLFQPFSQVHDTMQRTHGGTGLGLYICRGIIEDMGGTIWCESPGAGRGCTFQFRVPVGRVRGTQATSAAPAADAVTRSA